MSAYLARLPELSAVRNMETASRFGRARRAAGPTWHGAAATCSSLKMTSPKLIAAAYRDAPEAKSPSAPITKSPRRATAAVWDTAAVSRGSASQSPSAASIELPNAECITDDICRAQTGTNDYRERGTKRKRRARKADSSSTKHNGVAFHFRL